MFLERRTVSRKTAGDGRLEITKQAAGRIGDTGASIAIDVNGEHAAAALDTMACTCRGAEKPHVHYFIQSEPLKALPAGSEVQLDFDPDARCVRIRLAPPIGADLDSGNRQ
jgi:hypothetical protein